MAKGRNKKKEARKLYALAGKASGRTRVSYLLVGNKLYKGVNNGRASNRSNVYADCDVSSDYECR